MEAIESTSVELEQLNDRTLFSTSDPAEVLSKATEIAGILKKTIEAAGMVQPIGGREYVKVEGWQTLGSMLNITPVVTWTRALEDGAGWEARVEVRNVDGRVVSAAEAMTTKSERNWARRDPFALRSMAQTRAMSKALKIALGHVMVLSGLDATPAEEMTATEPAAAPELPKWARPASIEELTRSAHAVVAVLKATGAAKPAQGVRAIGEAVRERCDGAMPVCVVHALEDLVTAALETSEPEAAS